MAKIGVQQMCFHYESAFHVDRMLSLMQQTGIRPGIALMPATPLSVLEYCLERIEVVMLMLINPGFAGHKGETQVIGRLISVAVFPKHRHGIIG